MPPPNITGRLHMGHALFLSIQDSLNRYYKNTNRDSLWLPGLDHAGLATHDKIILKMKETNLDYNKSSSLIEKDHKEIILKQIQKTASLPDWRYLTYTLDYNDLLYKSLEIMKSQNRIIIKDNQYYLDLKDYANELLDNLAQINIIPAKRKKDLIPFLSDFKNWNISRDIPWGTKLNEKQTLDTWFNSSFWCISTLYKHNLLDFYPATILETGYDILFFWCARMLIISNWCYDNQKELGINLKSKYCFKDIYLHGIIRDKNGEKMSKSKNNGIDPLEIITKYGSDAIRLFLLTRTGPAEDIIWDDHQLQGSKKFINKIYQAGRFLSINAEKYGLPKLIIKTTDYNASIITEYCRLMESYNFLEANRMIQSQFKQIFCDEWIEHNKKDIWNGNRNTLIEGIHRYKEFLLMLEPTCPMISYFLLNNFFKK